jgi:hypothetical protein
MPSLSLSLLRVLVLTLVLGGCVAPSAPTPTPAVAVVIGTPYPAFAAATPPATLHDRPAGTAIGTLPRGTDLMVETVATGSDGQAWYLVTATGGERGWLPAASLTLVDDAVAATATPRPPAPTLAPSRPSVTPSPRPLVITGSGQGLFLRVEPGQGAVVRAYPDGTRVTPLGEMRELDGRRWVRVRAPDGDVGWMAAEYLRPG